MVGEQAGSKIKYVIVISAGHSSWNAGGRRGEREGAKVGSGEKFLCCVSEFDN